MPTQSVSIIKGIKVPKNRKSCSYNRIEKKNFEIPV